MQIFLELDGEKKEGMEFLDTTLTIGKADQVAKPTTLKSCNILISSRFWKQKVEQEQEEELEFRLLFVPLCLAS